jgi:hypothetical protein
VVNQYWTAEGGSGRAQREVGARASLRRACLTVAEASPQPSSFYEKSDVRIRYQEVGSGFPLLVTPGGGLSLRISNWAIAVFNAPDTLKNDFRCITITSAMRMTAKATNLCFSTVGQNRPSREAG